MNTAHFTIWESILPSRVAFAPCLRAGGYSKANAALGSLTVLAPKEMRHFSVLLLFVCLVCCSTTEHIQTPAKPKPEVATQRLQSPVNLRTAILTLPSNAVAGMPEWNRSEYLDYNPPPGVYKEKERRIEFICDNPYSGIHADSMLFLRLFEDEQGRTIAASHSARPHANGSKPSQLNTSIFRVKDGVWKDITEEVMPVETPRDWYFNFNEPGRNISCGPYIPYKNTDGSGLYYTFGKASHVIRWENGRFRAIRNGRTKNLNT